MTSEPRGADLLPPPMGFGPQATREPLDFFQAQVGQWAEATFPQSTLATIATHLDREAQELLAVARRITAIELGVPADQRLALETGHLYGELLAEAGDILMLLCHLAHKSGISLQGAARRKFGVIQGRTYGPPDAEGVREHVRAERELLAESERADERPGADAPSPGAGATSAPAG